MAENPEDRLNVREASEMNRLPCGSWVATYWQDRHGNHYGCCPAGCAFVRRGIAGTWCYLGIRLEWATDKGMTGE